MISCLVRLIIMIREYMFNDMDINDFTSHSAPNAVYYDQMFKPWAVSDSTTHQVGQHTTPVV
jgi:hypothetical protein